jgi:hypothetical protein
LNVAHDWGAYGLLDVFGSDELNVGDFVKVVGRGEPPESAHQVLKVTGGLVSLSNGKEFDFTNPGSSKMVLVWGGDTDSLLAELQMLVGRANTLRGASQFRPHFLARAYLALLKLTQDAEPRLENPDTTMRRFAKQLNRWFEENRHQLWQRNTPAEGIFLGRYDKSEAWFGIRHSQWNNVAQAARVSSSHAVMLSNMGGFLVKNKVRNPAVGPNRERCLIVDLLKLQEVVR